MITDFDEYKLVDDWSCAMNTLLEFRGETVNARAQGAIEHIIYLRRALVISQNNEKAAHGVIHQMNAELYGLRSRLRLARAYMQHTDPVNARAFFGELYEGDDDGNEERQVEG